MKRAVLFLAVSIFLVLAGPTAASAMGPVDGEVTAVYWFADGEAEGSSADADGPGVRAEVWFFKNFGVSAEVFKLEFDDDFGNADFDTTNLDVKWRPISPTENTFFAVGAGWQKVEIESVDTSGFRLVAEGRIGFAGIAYAYGRAAYMPSLDDIEVEGFTVADNVDGSEYDFGLAVEPAPFLTLRGGYRKSELNYDEVEGPGSMEISTDGFYAGAGFHW